MNGIRVDSTYDELSDYHKRCLPASNYWREKNGIQLIDVPTEDKHYHNYFKKSIEVRDQTISMCPEVITIPSFSFFPKPVTNVEKSKEVNLVQLYEVIRDEKYFKRETDELRRLYATDKKAYGNFKKYNFNYVTFSGRFAKREDSALLVHSGLLCMDLDHLPDVDRMREKILADENITTEFLFTSPGGNGLKWVVSIDIKECTHLEYFKAFEKYVQKKYLLKIDSACKDVSRACFVCHDPNVYINPQWLTRHS